MLYGHRAFYAELVRLTESLTDGKNAAFTEIRDARHTYEAWSTGLYNFLPVVFSLPGDLGGEVTMTEREADANG